MTRKIMNLILKMLIVIAFYREPIGIPSIPKLQFSAATSQVPKLGIPIPQLQIPSQIAQNKDQKKDPFSSPQGLITPVNELINVLMGNVDRQSSKPISCSSWKNGSRRPSKPRGVAES